jgi:transketolase C-terminal domain/subunit
MIRDRGIALDVVHISILRPLDSAPIVASAGKSQLVVTLENHVARGGYGDAVADTIGPIGIPHLRINLPEEFIPAGDPLWQLAYCKMDAHSITERLITFVEGKKHV